MVEQNSVMYAGATRRFCALLVDGIILGIVLGILTVILRGVTTNIMVQQGISQVLGALYYILLESSNRMASLGKSVMKIYVAMDEGKKAPIGTIALRYLIMMLPSLPLLCITYSSDYSNMLQTIQQYNDAHDPQGVITYMQSPEVKDIYFLLMKVTGFSGLLGTFLFWLPIVFTKQKTGLHDYLTKTRVFKRTA